MSNKTLIIATYSYPFSTGEQFLELELKVLSAYFEEIILLPKMVIGNKRKLPAANINVFIAETHSTKKTFKLTNIFSVLFIFMVEFYKTKHKLIYLKKMRYYISYLKNAFVSANDLYNQLAIHHPNAIYYTYWFDEITLQFSILKNQDKLKTILTRAHGGDVYEYQHQETDYIFPYRNFQMKTLNNISVVSNNGAQHIISDYYQQKNKVTVNHLACESFGLKNQLKSSIFTIVSCSTFYSYKRIPYLIETLKRCTQSINWIHIGDEGDEKEIALALVKQFPKHIKFEFKGFMNHTDIKELYNKQPINLFINVSKSEGMPVTLMEAISCGIPILATNVGGVSDIANEQTGIIIDVKTTSSELAVLLDEIIKGNHQLPNQKMIIRFWENNFSENNYDLFYKNVLCVA